MISAPRDMPDLKKTAKSDGRTYVKCTIKQTDVCECGTCTRRPVDESGAPETHQAQGPGRIHFGHHSSSELWHSETREIIFEI